MRRFTTTARDLMRNRKAAAGIIILAVCLIAALIPSVIAPDSPTATVYAPNQLPSNTHFLGTTSLGQDVWSQVIHGTRLTLWVTLLVTAIATLISTVVGITSAYIGGTTDRVMMILTDVFLILPVLPLLILLASYLPPGVTSLVIVLTVTSWAFQARQLRAQGLAIRNRDFLVAARVRGESAFYIIFREIVPTMTSLLAASFLALAIFEVGFAASLQFLGLGNSGQMMWGTVLYNAQQAAALESGNPWWALAPGAAVAFLGAGFAFINYAFDEIANPALKPRKRRSKRARAAA